ncbi:MAG: glutamyl-tRNA reductase [bacterium]
MNIVGISINHNTAAIELREMVHLNKDEIVGLIQQLKKDFFTEGFVLSTCNRTEIFGLPKSNISYQDIENKLLNFKPVTGIETHNFNKFFSCGAVKHIFSVTTGIDSLVIGDSQILGQVKEAFQLAEDVHFVGPILRRLFDTAVKVGKRAVRETRIGEGAVTISFAAVQVIEKIFANLFKKSALVIGAGDTGQLAAIHLKNKGVGKITITNRTYSRAEILAEKVSGSVLPFNKIEEHLHEFDIIVSATSSENLIVTKEEVKKMMKRRKGAPVILMDIALPRDIDPAVKELDNVFYHDIDSLQIIVKENLDHRKSEIPAVTKIIMDEMVAFFAWYNTLEVVPTIISLREFFEEIKNDELNKIKHKVSKEDFEKLEDMSRRLIGRLLHNPTIKLKRIAEGGINSQESITNALLIKELFGLDESRDDGSDNPGTN